MMKDKTKLTAAALALAVAVSSSTCSPNTNTAGSRATSGTPAAKTEYKYREIDLLGKDSALCRAPIYITYGGGSFMEEDFDVTLTSADTETRKVGLDNGTIPLINGDFQFFPPVEEGVQVRVVDGLHNRYTELVIPEGSKTTSVNDLKGKKTAVDEVSGTPHQVASVWLEKAGVPVEQEGGEVTFIPYTDGNLGLEAVKKDDVDMTALRDPLGSIAGGSDDYYAISGSSKDPTFIGRCCCFLYAPSKVLGEDPRKVSALFRAIRKTQDWISRDPKEAVDIISDKKCSAIEDEELTEKPIISYEYPSTESRETNPERIKENVSCFVQQLKDTGYLKIDDLDVFANQTLGGVDATPGI